MDAGLPGAAESIKEAAGQLYGTDAKPRAIILTHGHFDHVGAITQLINEWGVPVYAHEAEIPYLTGKQDYPPGDPSASSGVMARIAPLYPNEAINLGGVAQSLPEDGSVPFLAGWQWVHTPGHTPGHVPIFRENDRLLICGDAFITTEQESAIAVATQHQAVHSPPKYFTPDWQAAGRSVRRLAELKPRLAVTGHGEHMGGDKLEQQLQELAVNFEQLAVPKHDKNL